VRTLRVLPEAEEELAAAAVDGDDVVIVAIAHAKRRPGYWMARVRG
jgi:hypothetical protein